MSQLICKHCQKIFNSIEDLRVHVVDNHPLIMESTTEAKRNSTSFRFDIIDPNYIRMMAQIGDYGAKLYGDFNWQKSRLSGNKSPINHILKHTTAYIIGEPYDHPELGLHRKIHLAAVGFNAMMEFWYEENMGDKKG